MLLFDRPQLTCPTTCVCLLMLFSQVIVSSNTTRIALPLTMVLVVVCPLPIVTLSAPTFVEGFLVSAIGSDMSSATAIPRQVHRISSEPFSSCEQGPSGWYALSLV